VRVAAALDRPRFGSVRGCGTSTGSELNGGRMQHDTPRLTEQELQQRRQAIRRGLWWTISSMVAVLVVVVGLAVAALLQAYRAERNVELAQAASGRADEQRALAEAELWKAHLAQARLERASPLAGRRRRALEAVAGAARIRPELALRNEAIGALALMDVEQEAWWPLATNATRLTFDNQVQRWATCDRQGLIQVFGVEDGREQVRLPSIPTGAYGLWFSPEGQYLVARHWSQEVVVWDLQAQRRVFSFPVPERNSTWSLDFSVRHQALVVADREDSVGWFELASGRELARLAIRGPPEFVRLQPEEGIVAVGLGNDVELWNLVTGRSERVLRHPDKVFELAWHPAGKSFATGCRDEHIYLWTLASASPRALSGHTAPVVHLQFSHNADLLITRAWDGTTRFWEPVSGRALFLTHRGYGLKLSPDGRRLAFERTAEGVGIWRVEPGTGYRLLTPFEATLPNISALSLHGQGRLLAASTTAGLWLVDVKTDRLLEPQPMPAIASALFGADGRTLIGTREDGLTRWPIDATRIGSGDPGLLGPASELTWPGSGRWYQLGSSADGRYVIAGVGSDEAVLVDLEQPEAPVWLRDADYRSRGSVAVSPDGRWVATGTFHGSGTRVWDGRTGQTIRHLGGRSAAVDFSPDGNLLAVEAADAVTCFDTGTWQARWRVVRDAVGELSGPVAFSPDGRRLALCVSQRLVQLADAADGRELVSLNAPDPQFISALRFSRDGQTLLVGTTPGLIQVWQLDVLQRELAALNLAWPEPGLAPAIGDVRPPESGVGPDRLPALAAATRADRRINWFSPLVLVGVGVALLYSAFTLQRQRRLIGGYEDIERMVVARSRELEVAQAELLHSQKMRALGTLAAGIAHDFNNLLSVIRMANKLIGREARAQPDIEENVRDIEHAVQEGKTIVRSMLGYSREESVRDAPFSVAELVEDTIGLLGKRFLSGLTLTLELDRNLPMVTGSRGRLEQILLNLIVNASEAMQGQGKLRLEVRAHMVAWSAYLLRPRAAPQYLEVIVADSGPGIAPEVVPHIFEPFYTTKAMRTSPGTGLGLSMVYSLAQQDGLGLNVATAPGQGAAFHLLVPQDSSNQDACG